jgi:hypothetical protein
MKKAFDSTKRQILFHILKSINIPDTLLKQQWANTHKTKHQQWANTHKTKYQQWANTHKTK